VVALEQLHDVEAGDDFVAIRLKLVPAVGCERIADIGNRPIPMKRARAVLGSKCFMLIRRGDN
jgi:hypothetical protein